MAFASWTSELTLASLTYPVMAGTKTAARMPMMAITTINSVSVKAFLPLSALP